MGYKKMKFDLYVIKAVQSKGLEVEDLVKMQDSELDDLALPLKIIDAIKSYKSTGFSTENELISGINESKNESESTSPDVISKIKESAEVLQNIVTEETVTDTSTDEVIRKVASIEDLDIIKEVLNKKEARTFAAYTKLLKAEVPAAILDAVESTTINDLIDKRIAEVKASDDSSTK